MNTGFEEILKRMLDRVPSNIDKREGSIIYDAIAPAAVELQLMYIELDTIMNETFADTASREYLIKRGSERGIIPVGATKAILKGEFNINVAIGSRFSLENLSYVVVGKITDLVFKLECETLGTCGNTLFGKLIPIDYIAGLTKGMLTELLIPGEDEEETEAFRKRYFSSLNSQAFGGNVEDYKEKVNAVPGVGGVRVYPVWNGGGTVKVLIIDSDFNVPGNELIEEVQNKLDPTQNHGEGIGIAPIGHVVTVMGVVADFIKIEATITYVDGWAWEDVQSYVYEILDKYFLDLRRKWSDGSNAVIRISQLESRILEVEGVLDIWGTKINGAAENYVVDEGKVPVRGDVVG